MNALNALYESLEQKIGRLMEQVRYLKKENEKLKMIIEEKENTLQNVQKMLKEYEEQNELLKTSILLINVDKEGIEGANRRINNLVREIDECIALLTKE